jgi:plasmid segregation protein ParM
MTEVLAIDVGHGYTKAMTARKQKMILSQVGPAEHVRFESDVAAPGQGVVLEADGRWFSVGEEAELQSASAAQTLSIARTGSVEQKALFYAAASEVLRPATEKVVVVTGLPVLDYDDGNKAALRDMLRGEHVVNRRGRGRRQRRFTVTDVHIVPQAFGSYYALVLDRHGQLVNSDLPGGRVGIIDVGMYTTNFILADQLRYVEMESGSITTGMGETLQKVARDLQREHKLNWGQKLGKVDRAVRERAVEVKGARVNIAGMVDGHLASLADSIISQAQTLWGGGEDLRAVILTGGGSLELAPYVRKAYPHTRTVGGDPQFANVIGFLRAGLRRLGGTD